MLRLSLAVVVALLASSASPPAAAQGITGGYRPATPTLSPWLNLYQRSTGPLDPYHQWVRPELNLRETLQQQDLANQRQAVDIAAVGHQVTQLEQDRAAPIRPTGTGSGFMSLSHYYPAAGQGAARTGARPRASWSPSPASHQAGGVGRGM
jgi:hypothetical protein